jgi:UDP-N-acetylmuramyl pentapeptide phosphotransferase/UDP-N-acetylglucosamine-1-phosphate transferase
MLLLFISFFSSMILILGIIRYKHLHEKFSGDYALSGPQKFHTNNTPRIGGLGIYLALWIANAVAFFKEVHLPQFITFVLLSALPVFAAGLIEDLTKQVGVKIRLLAGLLSGALLLYFFQITSIRLDVWGLDTLFMNIWVAGIFLAIACSGLSNAYNIIDGFNGLASMVAFISTAAIAFVAFKANDIELVYIALILLGSIAGFFIWNYPKGLIFLGDGGAYLIGFVIAALSILLVQRNPGVSPWFALLVNAYPIFETLFTVWRRSLHQGRNPALPDGAHFHSLIYRRAMRWANPKSAQIDHHYLGNAKTSPYLWVISCIGVVPAILFWNNTLLLMLSAIIFMLLYVYLYRRVVRFNKPSWLNTRSPK